MTGVLRPAHLGLRHGLLEPADVLAVLLDVRRQRRENEQRRDAMLGDHRPGVADAGGEAVHRAAARLRQAAVTRAHVLDPSGGGAIDVDARQVAVVDVAAVEQHERR